MEDVDAPLIYNGVVYNEMKGAYSSPDDVLGEEIQKALYPDTAYSKDSGGYPVDIPNLTYEQFIDFHSHYYHPSNSFIYLYGDMDMTERLEWMDAEYLSHYERIQLNSLVELQKPFTEVAETSAYYSIGEDESEEHNAYLAWARVMGEGLSAKEDTALDLLEYVLLDAPGAPVKQALIDAGIGADVYGYFDDNTRQPYFGIIAKGADVEQKEQFVSIIQETLAKLAHEGISKKSLLAGLNNMEFRAKEADFGYYPKGLMYGLDVLSRWLYDDGAAFDTLAFQQVFDELRQDVETDYFEHLIQEKLLDNTHGAHVLLKPKRGYSQELEQALSEKLSAIREGLSEEEREAIVEHTRALKKFQETPSTEEELEKIPMLSVADVDTQTAPLYIRECTVGDVPAVHHDVFASGISYIALEFDGHGLTTEDIPYAALLQLFLGMVNTAHYSYQELGDEVMIKTGGIAPALNVIARKDDTCMVKMEMSVKVLPSQLQDGLELVWEIMQTSDFTDKKRVKELVSQAKARMNASIMGRGDLIASMRACSYYAEDAYLNDLKSGVAFYQFLEELDAHFDERVEELIARLKAVSGKLFTKPNLLISFTGVQEDFDAFEKAVTPLLEKLSDAVIAPVSWDIHFEAKNEGFKTASQVNYVARCGNYHLADENKKFTGALRVLKVWMSYEYLWVNIRVKGGAYGCAAQFLRNGDVRLSSYRDPKCKATSQVFMDTPEAIEQMKLSDRDLTKYILGAINELDTPLTPAKKGGTSLAAYLTGTTWEDLQEIREQVLSTTKESLCALAPRVKVALDQNYICAVGNASQIEADKDVFKTVQNLFH
jgi:hypothetical protein